ncbi:sensor histidine kinase [Natronomonas amylolytica]|uniref:sensor histidine kinase n=1 Tax=Natronomonas amylolytica TaxID=3108498 RepID=UPI00300B97CD
MALGSPRREVTAGGVVLIGCLTVLAHLYHLRIEESIHSRLLGVVFPLILSSILVFAGIWLYRSPLESSYTARVAAWTGIGLFGGVAFGYPVVPYQAVHGITVADIPFLMVNWATTGALGGFLIGIYNARHRQYRDALEAERAELAARERELERQNERLERFTHIVSHDLRNPLTVAAGRLELARQDGDSEHLDAMETALERMETLIDELLALARQEQTIDDTDWVSLSMVANNAWATVDTKAATLQVDDDDLTVKADSGRLQQLFENLFRNAIDHAGEDVTVRVGGLSDTAGFYVADTGPGIPEAERDDVFTYGYSTAEDGTGFGLAIVSEIAEAHGWEITLTDSEEGGTRFEISGTDVRNSENRSLNE